MQITAFGKDLVITGYREMPNKTFDLRVEYVKLPPPTPEKFQLKARMRRLKQQLRDGQITSAEFGWSVKSATDDYSQRP